MAQNNFATTLDHCQDNLHRVTCRAGQETFQENRDLEKQRERGMHAKIAGNLMWRALPFFPFYKTKSLFFCGFFSPRSCST